MKIAINNVKKNLNQILISTLFIHNPDFYNSILESAERGELWGMSAQENHYVQLKLDLNLPCASKCSD